MIEWYVLFNNRNILKEKMEQLLPSFCRDGCPSLRITGLTRGEEAIQT